MPILVGASLKPAQSIVVIGAETTPYYTLRLFQVISWPFATSAGESNEGLLPSTLRPDGGWYIIVNTQFKVSGTQKTQVVPAAQGRIVCICANPRNIKA